MSRTRTRGTRAAFAFWIAIGFGVFVKHFSGLLPLAVALAWLGAGGGRPALKRLVSWPGIVVFALLTASWLVPFARGGGGAGRFATDIVWGDWLRQHIGGPRLATLGGELGIALLGFLPWTLLLPVALAAGGFFGLAATKAIAIRRMPPAAGTSLGWFRAASSVQIGSRLHGAR